MAEPVDHYAVLGIDPAAGIAEVRRAFTAAARRHHPDRGGDPERMRAVSEAWAVLGDPEARRRYDRLRRAERAEGEPAPPFVSYREGTDLDDERDGGSSVIPPRRPLTPGVVLLPPGLFVASVATGSVALVVDSPGVLGLAVGLFSLSCVAVAVVALLTLRGNRS